MTYLTSLLWKDPNYRQLLQTLKADYRRVYSYGLVRESTGHFIASLGADIKRPVFVVCENPRRALELAEDIRSLQMGEVSCFPEKEEQYYKMDSLISEDQIRLLESMNLLVSGENPIIVSSLGALRRRLSPPLSFINQQLIFRSGEEADREGLVHSLQEMMYERVDTVEHKGQFAVRGSILDIFPPDFDQAVRIEFFDTEVDSIRLFDVNSQRSTETREEVQLGPASELSFSQESLPLIRKGVEADLAWLEKHPAEGRDDLHAGDKFRLLLDLIGEGGSLSNQDLLSPYLPREDYAYITDYLPPDSLVVFEDINRIKETAETQELARQAELTGLLKRGELLPTHLKAEARPAGLFKALRPFQSLNISQILKQTQDFQPEKLVEVRSMEMEIFHNRWDDFLSFLKRQQARGASLLILAGPGAENLTAQLQNQGVKASLAGRKEEVGRGEILVSPLRARWGFSYPAAQSYVISQSNINGREKIRRKAHRPKKAADLLNYQDLERGDYVVHEVYGIGRYIGTEQLEVEGIVKDFIKISYSSGDLLYVPTDDMELVSKYIGSGEGHPRLSSLGGKGWIRAKERAQKAVDAIAEDLVELYAQRSQVQGHAYPPDTPWQKSFEEDFPYEETPSQLRATRDIKKDMEKPQPMDRLLCGDVGYGKTEVALRAAFKAIMDGKQVAFLCPTTILTQQHYETMIERFRDYPVRIEFLSRFKSQDQQKAVVRDLAAGRVELVVGTHRLLSSDVHFKDLGLLIIDEEQRFGVKDKEKIKKMRTDVDVLSLSATPIPRTLQLSLTGIRDMSLLEEPPENRYPTTSYVMEFNPGIIQDAIYREMGRQGQVYFVYNRVQDIDKVYHYLKTIVPEARILVGHGQMTNRQLENIMEDFVRGEADILLSTTIIETGMDIPNVNTLIVANADRMGLSQLYQLKGRIGRSDRQSFAYFTYPQGKVLPEASEKRLKAIQDFSDFGSGYKIAMRDLELRGAGNLLGESQSGHIASIGYDLFVRLLREAAEKASGKEREEVRSSNIKVDIRVDTYIPQEYIPDSGEKIRMYRAMASIENEEDYSRIIEELIDRFGDPPKSVVNVMDVALIQSWAGRIGFSEIKEKEGQLLLYYEQFEQFSLETLKDLSDSYQGPLKFDFQGRPRFKLPASANKTRELLRLLKVMLGILKNEKKSRVNGGKNE